ncbi:MAG: hypothetical protein ACR2M3_01575 [Thermomicrobiales bacterium]
MIDVRLWAHVIDHITAIERDPDIALMMLQKAQRLGVRGRLTLLEMGLVDAMNMMAAEEASLPPLSISQQQKLREARGIGYDIVNFDMCGGFLYPTLDKDSDNARVFRYLVDFQARRQRSFFLLVTYQIKDTGADEYDKYIDGTLSTLSDTLTSLGRSTANVTNVRNFYLAKGSLSGQSPHLRRYRFSIPVFLHEVADYAFQVNALGSWYYKNLYHLIVSFDLRQGGSVLGRGPWPPYDEVKQLLEVPLVRLKYDKKTSEIQETALKAPSL